MICQAKQIYEKDGQLKVAYEKYCEGLQGLLEVLPKLPEDDPGASDLRMRVDGYLAEAEGLKAKLDAEMRIGAGREVRLEEQGTTGKARGAPPPSSGGGFASLALEPKDQDTLDKGLDLTSEGRALEERGLFKDAYDKYCRGLQFVLEVMPKVSKDGNPEVGRIGGSMGGVVGACSGHARVS
ncbi:unnamed protein product [Prorocentrum cordatum]|uniref:MIT domain-containing protein n=1 Tax=Prorocentrum cordatum TaxID=2364126 RepID=A0ABN9Y8F0_9DINO|nr:unnamed protein product [Polarella glacialis]